MKQLRCVQWGFAMALCMGSALFAGEEAAKSPALSTSLKYRTFREWKFDLPAEKFQPVGAELKFAERQFSVKPEGTSLWIDRDGDGETDVKAEGKDASVTLLSKNAEGAKRRYSLRLVNQQGWKYSCGGAWVGKIGGTKITIFDQDLNGSYADFGRDAMVIGRGKLASYLSKVIHIDGKLYEIDIESDGSQLTYRPFEGPTGEFQLAYQTRAKVLSALVKSADGRYSFDLAHARESIELPVAEYGVERGQLGLGGSRVWFRNGRAKTLSIKAGEKLETTWGGPVNAEFAYQRTADEVQLSPDAVWYFGAGGEEYHGWNPVGKSPKFTIRAKRTGREIAEAFFPGTC